MTTFKSLLGAIALSFSAAVAAGPVNINTATADQLQAELSGVGPVVAARIVSWRARNGEFTQPEQLVRVRGLGDKTLAKNREFIRID